MEETVRMVESLEEALLIVADETRSPRVRLLVAALQNQLEEVRETVERIGEKQVPAASRRALIKPPEPPPMVLPPTLDDSRAVTGWLVAILNGLIERTRALATQRLGRAASGVVELQQLLVAQSKRIAIEAHRFEDL
jgi:hypothetical protein